MFTVSPQGSPLSLAALLLAGALVSCSSTSADPGGAPLPQIDGGDSAAVAEGGDSAPVADSGVEAASDSPAAGDGSAEGDSGADGSEDVWNEGAAPPEEAGVDAAPGCGDGLCGLVESCSSCAADCGPCPATSSNLLYDESFETDPVWVGVHQQFGQPYSFGVADSPAFVGAKSGRFELRDTDPDTSGGTRAEVLFPEQTNLHRWYAFAVYFPSADHAFDSFTEIVTQWHQGGGLSPSIALELKADRYVVVIPADAAGASTTERTDIGAVTKDAWNRFVFHIKHASDSTGLLEIWLNQTKLMTRTGSNMYSLSTTSPPRWKVGIYKWKWNLEATTDTDKRVRFYDSIRIGSEKASLSEM